MAGPAYDRHGVTVHLGDCADVLHEIGTASVDAIVTDPPYELGFMGRAWDASGIAYSVPMWAECLRVLKPGGHLLAFGAPRTAHRLAAGIEDAGFEIRDTIMWLYGSGFPKSLDVAKAIDKARDDTDAIRVVCRWLRARIDEHPVETTRTLAARFGFHTRMVEHWAARDTDSQPSCPTVEQWEQLRGALGFGGDVDDNVWRLNGRKGTPGEAWDRREVVGEAYRIRRPSDVQLAGLSDGAYSITAPATANARQWEGWGTALKPAQEPIVVARKPLAGTVAQTVLRHGTGALHIDACRVGMSVADAAAINAKHAGMDVDAYQRMPGSSLNLSVNPLPLRAAEAHAAGRWPTNVALTHAPDCGPDEQPGPCVDGCPVAELDQQSGGGSRFFPVFRWEAKAPTSERPQVGGHSHPTVKPIALMRWLVRLVVPAGGLVLDPFAGSGTTLHAARAEGMRAVGIEREPDYIDLIRARLDARPRQAEQADAPRDDEPLDLLDLLGGEAS